MFEQRRNENNTRLAEIRAQLTNTETALTDEQITALDTEARNLTAELTGLERRETVTRGMNGGQPASPEGGDGGHPGPVNPITGRGGMTPTETGDGRPGTLDSRAARLAAMQGIAHEAAEERAQRFAREGTMRITTDALYRSLTLSGGNIAQPSRVSGITPGQNVVSGIVDMVRVVDADGMGEDSEAYEVSGGQTAKTKKDDGKATTESTPTLKVAKIVPVLVSTLAYVSRNIQRTTPLNYQERTSASALNALRQKVGSMIATGSGDATAANPEITGIIKAAAIQAGSDLEITAIDHTTLRKIALSYGGAANVEGGGVLLLNKADLIAFGDIRGEKEKKAVYEIEFAENSTTTGTIKDGGLSVRFCIVDDLPALSAAATEDGAYSMCYGKPLAYQLDLFGPYEVEISRDYKFAEGLLAVMGTAMVGGNVIAENGFIRVKKKAAAQA